MKTLDQFPNLSANRWRRGGDYVGADLSDMLEILGTHRDADTLQRSNFEVGRKIMEAAEENYPEPPDADLDGYDRSWIQVHKFGHWAVGWTKVLMIRDNAPAGLLAEAEKILQRLEDYPILSEDHFSELEWSEACDLWEHASVRDRVYYVQRYGQGCSIFAARRNELPSDMDVSGLVV